jgi:hypothetical protein
VEDCAIYSSPADQQHLIIKKFDDAITALVDAVASQNLSGGPYSDQVYEAARKIAKTYRKWKLLRGLV